MPFKHIVDGFEIEEIEYHRNGVSGEGFHIVKFISPSDGPMVAILFRGEHDEDEDKADKEKEGSNGRCAVFNRDKLKEDDFRFFYNSWRGDHYEPAMRQAIFEHRQKERAEMMARIAEREKKS